MSNISVNLKDTKIMQIDRLAQHLDRTRSWVINEALDEYLSKQEGMLAAIREAVQQADAEPDGGRPHDEVAEDARRLLKEELRK